jgi:hypothetical protein
MLMSRTMSSLLRLVDIRGQEERARSHEGSPVDDSNAGWP